MLKTLGATRARIAQVFSVEFLVLGLLAGFVVRAFANLLARVLLHRMQVTFHVSFWPLRPRLALLQCWRLRPVGWRASGF